MSQIVFNSNPVSHYTLSQYPPPPPIILSKSMLFTNHNVGRMVNSMQGTFLLSHFSCFSVVYSICYPPMLSMSCCRYAISCTVSPFPLSTSPPSAGHQRRPITIHRGVRGWLHPPLIGGLSRPPLRPAAFSLSPQHPPSHWLILSDQSASGRRGHTAACVTLLRHSHVPRVVT